MISEVKDEYSGVNAKLAALDTDKLNHRQAIVAMQLRAALRADKIEHNLNKKRPAGMTFRLSVANKALETFAPTIKLYEGTSGLRMSWGREGRRHYDYAARLRSDGSWPMYGYHTRPTGGTGCQALAQLIRYVHDWSRLPMDTWEYWAGERIKLCTPDTLFLLQHSDYGNPAKTSCVLCGSSDWDKNGLDWWSLDDIVGPSCSHGRCIPDWMSAPANVNFKKWLKALKEAKLCPSSC